MAEPFEIYIDFYDIDPDDLMGIIRLPEKTTSKTEN